MKESPRVTAIIPVFNRPDLLRHAIESVLVQSFEDYELIVVDDASTEDLRSVVQELAPNATYVRHDINKGAAAARNTGIRLAKGEYIACLDSDDEWTPDKLQKQVEFLDSNPEIGLVGAAAILTNIDGEYQSGPVRGSGDYSVERMSISVGLPGCGANEMIPKRVYEDVGLFNEKMRRVQDWEMYYRIRKRYPIHVLDDPLLRRRAHETLRHGINTEVIRSCRRMFVMQVDDPQLKRASLAYTEFRLFQRQWRSGTRFEAIKCLIRSFAIFPKPIPKGHRRLIPILDAVAPAMLNQVRAIRRRVLAKDKVGA